MAKTKKGAATSFLILAGLAAAGIFWFFYTVKSAAPPLPETTMPVVFNTKYDGSVWQIRDWLKSNADRYASARVTHWGRVVALKGGFLVHVRFEAKNASGAYVTYDKVFRLDKAGNITGMADFKPGAH